jgi:hypothetical protein
MAKFNKITKETTKVAPRVTKKAKLIGKRLSRKFFPIANLTTNTLILLTVSGFWQSTMWQAAVAFMLNLF